jgi:ATP/maltotriose-dependent transcriptional regulator MalT
MANARKAGNHRLVARSAMGFAMGALAGPTPVPDAIAECQRSIDEGLSDRQAQSVIQCVLAQLRAMNGEFDEARRLYREGRAMLRELGQGVIAASTAIDVARVELLAGDLAAAEREVRADYDFLKQSGETYVLATLEGMLSRIVRDQGRDAEALAMTQAVEAAAAEDDVEAQVQWRAVRAMIVAHSGDVAGAEAMAREAVEMARQSDSPVLLADTLCEWAAVLRTAGREQESLDAAAEAARLYDAKGDQVSAARLR